MIIVAAVLIAKSRPIAVEADPVEFLDDDEPSDDGDDSTGVEDSTDENADENAEEQVQA